MSREGGSFRGRPDEISMLLYDAFNPNDVGHSSQVIVVGKSFKPARPGEIE